ncbi:MAG: SDR family oxidoreductase [Solirubrobacteraceae bacterium]
MTTAVISATGRVGSEIVHGVLAGGGEVVALVRDPDKARRAFGEPDGLHIRPTRLGDPRDLSEAFQGIRTVFIAMGSIGIEGVLQRIAINAAAGSSSIEQVTRLSVLNSRSTHLGSISERTTASTSSPPRPQCRIRRFAPRSSRRRCLLRRARCAPRAHGPALPAAAAWP